MHKKLQKKRICALLTSIKKNIIYVLVAFSNYCSCLIVTFVAVIFLIILSGGPPPGVFVFPSHSFPMNLNYFWNCSMNPGITNWMSRETPQRVLVSTDWWTFAMQCNVQCVSVKRPCNLVVMNICFILLILSW